MKIVLIVILAFYSTIGKSQGFVNYYWLPLKRVEFVNKFKIDRCDSLRESPFREVKFLSNKEISLFGFNASDPDVCKIIQKNTNTWVVKDSIFNTLVGSYPGIYKGTKIILRIDNRKLHVTLVNKRDTIVQEFVSESSGVNFIRHRQSIGLTFVGNLLISGKFIMKNSSDTVQFLNNGAVKNLKHFTNTFSSFKFVLYNLECDPGEATQRIIELTTSAGISKRFFIKCTNYGFDFYTIRSMKNPGTVNEIDFAFSILRIG